MKVYENLAVPRVFFPFGGVEIADDLHLTSAGNLVSFDFTIFASTGASSTTALVNFYVNNPTDSIIPPSGLIASFSFSNLPTNVIFTQTFDLVTPVALPQDVWMGVTVGQSGQFAAVTFSDFGVLSTLGTTHNKLFIDFFGGFVTPIPIQANLVVRIDDGAPPPNLPPTCDADLSTAQAQFLEPSPGSFVVTEDETITVAFTGNDPDGDDLTAALSGVPAAATLTPTASPAPLSATFQWTPSAADKAGAPYSVVVTFEDPLGETASCAFTIDDINLRPVCDAGGGVSGTLTFECDIPSGRQLTLSGSATDPDDDDAGLMFHWDVSDMDVMLDDPDIATPTGVFPVGVTMATLTVTDGRGGVDVCDVVIEVQDTTPPEVMCTTNVASLWPPKHNMRNVALIIVATDECQEPDFIFPLTVTVRCDEPDNANGVGDGNTTGDVDGQDGFAAPVNVTGSFTWNATAQAYTGTIQLRAERDGTGDGRAYIIDVLALDSQGNFATTSCVVVVPHDRRGGQGNNN